MQAQWTRLRKSVRTVAGLGPRLPRLAMQLLRGGFEGRVVQVENTNHCNFRCEYCATHAPNSLVKTQRGHMSMKVFAEILDRHPEAMLIVVQGDGEPLLDPTLFDKLSLARERGLLTQVISNGSMLRGPMVERLLDEGPDILLFSLDAVSPERNQAQRSGLKYHDVVSGIRKLTLGKAERKSAVAIGLLSIVHGPLDHEVREALLSFNELGIDLLLYKQLNPAFAGRIDGYAAPAAPPLPRALRSQLNYQVSHQRLATISPCPQLRWNFPYYLWDGQRTACCVLNDASYAKPELQRDALLARYQSSSMLPECESCTFFAGYPK